MRKLLIDDAAALAADEPATGTELDLRACAVVHFSSEHPDFPVDHLFDGHTGPGATRWRSARRSFSETILLIFDEPVNLSHCAFDAEERELERTQEVCAEYLATRENVYRRSFIQEFNFSPAGATYQQERIEMHLGAVRRFRLSIRPNKSGDGFASLTRLSLFV